MRTGGFYGWPWFTSATTQIPRHKGRHPEPASEVIVPDVLVHARTRLRSTYAFTPATNSQPNTKATSLPPWTTSKPLEMTAKGFGNRSAPSVHEENSQFDRVAQKGDPGERRLVGTTAFRQPRQRRSSRVLQHEPGRKPEARSAALPNHSEDVFLGRKLRDDGRRICHAVRVPLQITGDFGEWSEWDEGHRTRRDRESRG